ncbi:hypothetical protein MPRS_00060 [Mycobacterium paraseoulense]|nr:hypothetical protein MPRS_00060 [Mycobacterium paraseoulense]
MQTAVDTFGGLDIIVNNAGYTWDSVIQKMTDEQWDAILDVHLKAPFHILRAAQPVISGLVKQAKASGEPVPCRKVVNISSLAGVGGNAGQANYASAKAGILGLTRPSPRSGAATTSPSTRWRSDSSRLGSPRCQRVAARSPCKAGRFRLGSTRICSPRWNS